MKKIINLIKKAVKPGPSKGRTSLHRGQPRKLTPWQRSQAELLRLFATPQNHAPVPTWADSLRWLQAAAYA